MASALVAGAGVLGQPGFLGRLENAVSCAYRIGAAADIPPGMVPCGETAAIIAAEAARSAGIILHETAGISRAGIRKDLI